MLLLGASGAVAMRRSGAEEVASKVLAPKAADEDGCDSSGKRLEDSVVAAEVRPGDGLLRLRKAAQRICDGLAGRGAFGSAAHATAIYAACKNDGGAPGYRCKGTNSTEEAEKKMHATEVIAEKDVKLYTRINKRYLNLQGKLEDANRDGDAPESLVKAAGILATHRGEVEAREALCRANMDNLKDCGEPLMYFIDLHTLYTDIGTGVDSLAGAADTCTSTKNALLGIAGRGAKSIDLFGRRAIAEMWRNRVALMSAVVIAEGAKPFIKELVATGMDEALATPLGDAFESVATAMKAISCELLEEPLLMAELVHVSAHFLGTTMVNVIPEDRDVDIEGFKAPSQGLKGVPKAFVQQARKFAQVLSHNSAVPVASEILVIFAHKFFHELAGGICEAMATGTAGAVNFAKEAVKTSSSKLFAEASTKVSGVPIHAAKASSAWGMVPRGGANILAAGAFGGILDGTVFADAGLEGAREAKEILAEIAAEEVVAKPRRGKRDKVAQVVASLAQVEAQEGSALLESSAEGFDPLGALAKSFSWMAKKTPKTPETKELISALSNVQVALPMFALVAWSGEHIFALMDAESSSDAPPTGPMPTLKELKAKSKDIVADVQKLADDAAKQCSSDKVKTD